jgi:hypothetical protein
MTGLSSFSVFFSLVQFFIGLNEIDVIEDNGDAVLLTLHRAMPSEAVNPTKEGLWLFHRRERLRLT